jgi:hypothetical protein
MYWDLLQLKKNNILFQHLLVSVLNLLRKDQGRSKTVIFPP